MRKNNSFWNRVEKDYNKFKKWSKYKQSITISADTASTGKFIGGKK